MSRIHQLEENVHIRLGLWVIERRRGINEHVGALMAHGHKEIGDDFDITSQPHPVIVGYDVDLHPTSYYRKPKHHYGKRFCGMLNISPMP